MSLSSSYTHTLAYSGGNFVLVRYFVINTYKYISNNVDFMQKHYEFKKNGH